jgi:hypothetical protein
MISFFINLALFCIGLYFAIVIAILAFGFLGALLGGALAGLVAMGMAAYSTLRAVVMLDGIPLWIARSVHFAFSVWILVIYVGHDYAPAEYEAASWVILVGLLVLWLMPWIRELVIRIRTSHGLSHPSATISER